MKLEFESRKKYYNIISKVQVDENIREKPFYSAEQSLRKVVLRKKPNAGYFLEFLKNVRTDNKPKENEKDRGHFIPNIFKPYLLTDVELKEYKKEIDVFFGKGNKDNISPQSEKSNRIAQLFLEQKVNDYFEKTEKEDAEVYFEIEEVKIDEKILGRRIFIHWYEVENKDDIHVFIPEEENSVELMTVIIDSMSNRGYEKIKETY